MLVHRDFIRASAFAVALGVICGRPAWRVLHGPGPASRFTLVTGVAMYVGFMVYVRMFRPLRARAKTAWETLWIDLIVAAVWMGPWVYLYYHLIRNGLAWAGLPSMLMGVISGQLIFELGRRPESDP